MRRLVLISLSTICLAACASFARARDAVVGYATELINWALAILPASPPAFAFAGERVAFEGFGGFADPHVLRHEAGQSRRAAARGI